MLTILLNFYNSIKTWLLGLTALATGVLGILFLYEKNKVAIDDALVKETKVTSDLATDDAKIAQNNQQLQTLEQQREAIEKEPENAPTSSNIVDLFNSRK